LKTEDLIQDGWSKYTLRKVLEGEIPKQITWRRDKKGFSVPETKWLMETSAFWTDFIEEKSVLDKSGVVDIGQLRTDLPRIFSSSVFAREQNFVFRYVCYLIWIEQFKIEHFA
jgi:asparagine synthetase B (glutamine-hydrolysing)